MPADPATVWTIGHSTRTLEEFLGLLGEYRIEAIADVRRFPGSRRHPHFASDALAATLPAHGIAYRWMPRLGGRRKVQPGSPNTAWRNAAFRGYADYTATTEFAEGLVELLKLAAQKRTAMMCAEAVWWRCHRSIIADVLKLRGIEVTHIIDATHSTVHPYTSPAHIVDGRLSYAPAQGGLL
ncbi:hypothetical protein RHOFW510R12_18230 [Rhodanobacter sp. FW510-R12]|uniref:DUF488 domain-containing protein n=1 Tax=unclassified Rhodanobacter TaxID=2621553 RepID=UPI0007AA1BDB|nr:MULTISPECIES: DUF488 domain-containing protein [unclassified Rhodanobacter]KZC16263.1 hypothetical protein RHOFW104R8_00630 [Rhodanobacter sp. FW104-R8]KZC26811.1 hypothetical protein RhoFW510T8_00385 [Rhodanobacter sp. FW510-T8]KZC31019.1 hypothetical protein RhoFW510R10_00455 [Rhodanobacter sp. FW510-R10]